MKTVLSAKRNTIMATANFVLLWFAHCKVANVIIDQSDNTAEEISCNPFWDLFNWFCSVDWFRFFFQVVSVITVLHTGSCLVVVLQQQCDVLSVSMALLAWAERYKKKVHKRQWETDGGGWRRLVGVWIKDVFRRQMAGLRGRTGVKLKTSNWQREGRPP